MHQDMVNKFVLCLLAFVFARGLNPATCGRTTTHIRNLRDTHPNLHASISAYIRHVCARYNYPAHDTQLHLNPDHIINSFNMYEAHRTLIKRLQKCVWSGTWYRQGSVHRATDILGGVFFPNYLVIDTLTDRFARRSRNGNYFTPLQHRYLVRTNTRDELGRFLNNDRYYNTENVFGQIIIPSDIEELNYVDTDEEDFPM
jgi:hypothetical protein